MEHPVTFGLGMLAGLFIGLAICEWRMRRAYEEAIKVVDAIGALADAIREDGAA